MILTVLRVLFVLEFGRILSLSFSVGLEGLLMLACSKNVLISVVIDNSVMCTLEYSNKQQIYDK